MPYTLKPYTSLWLFTINNVLVLPLIGLTVEKGGMFNFLSDYLEVFRDIYLNQKDPIFCLRGLEC